MDSATLSAHFEKFTNLTPLEKMDSPNFPYLPPLNWGRGQKFSKKVWGVFFWGGVANFGALTFLVP